MPTFYYLILSFVLFLIGTTGVLLRRNALVVLMGIELQLNAGNLAMLTYSRALGDEKGHVFAFLIIALAAAEAAVPEALPDPERTRMQEIFDQVTDHLKREPAQSSRLLQSWIHSE